MDTLHTKIGNNVTLNNVAKLLPGDIIILKPKTLTIWKHPISWIISKITKAHWTHAGIYGRFGDIVESLPEGVVSTQLALGEDHDQQVASIVVHKGEEEDLNAPVEAPESADDADDAEGEAE